MPGMVIESETEEVHEARRTALELLFSDHVGDCLSPCHRLCPLQLNIPALLRHIEGGRMEEATGLVRQTLPLAGVLGEIVSSSLRTRLPPWELGFARRNPRSGKICDGLGIRFRVLPMMKAAPAPENPSAKKRVVIIAPGRQDWRQHNSRRGKATRFRWWTAGPKQVEPCAMSRRMIYRQWCWTMKSPGSHDWGLISSPASNWAARSH